MNKTLRIQIDEDDVLIVWFDHRDKSVNTLSPLALDELEVQIESLERRDHAPRGVVFTSGKADVFITGADLFELSGMDQEQKRQFLQRGQDLFDRIARLPMPTVAAINGHCLGGGLELALACTWRVAADRGSINIGLPETKLGLIPGWGGTTRLTHLLGPTQAIPIMATAKIVPPRRAQRAGIVDEVVRPEALLAAARRLVKTPSRTRRPSLFNRLIIRVPPLCDLVCRSARHKTLAKTFGNYPAAESLIDTVRTACRQGHAAGLRAERDALLRLAQSDACQNLMRLFFLRHDAKRIVRQKLDPHSAPVEVQHAAVIGAGTMGAGIVHALIGAGVMVRMVDVDENAISQGLRRIKKLLDEDVKGGRLNPLQAEQAMYKVSPATLGTDSGNGTECGLKLADMVIEAVAENIEVKRQVFENVDRLARPDAVLASNTSSLSITEIANATRHPQRVIGLHFFNPVAKMPLVEVVRSKYSDDTAVATGVELGLHLGKTPIVVADGPGFLVNRVLIPYLAESLVLASQGVSIIEIDRTMKKWGMPMGPFELLDQVGLDVAAHILRSFRVVLGSHILVPDGFESAVESNPHGWLGRKSGRGFYDYSPRRFGGKRGLRPNTRLIELLTNSNGSSGTIEHDEAELADRLVLPMINEAARLLLEGITDSTDTIDLATVLGLGLAPFRGGLIHYAETVGLDRIVDRMDEMTRRHGPRFRPVSVLRRLADAHLPMQEMVHLEPATSRPNHPSTAAVQLG